MADRIEDRAPEERLQNILGWGLRLGTLAVAAGMAVALIWSVAIGAFPSTQSAPLWPRASFDPAALVLLTALLLVLLPPARVVLAAVAFAREREWLYLTFSVVALALIAASTLLGLWLRRG
jgi:hypothetical protein